MDKNQRSLYAKQLLERLNYLTLATVNREGQPWNSPVFYAYDGKKTFYWGSRQSTQHSQNISENARGFIVIYDSTVEPYHGEAVYAQVLCEELKPTEISRAIKLLHTKLGESYMTPADVQDPAEHRLYKATIENSWIKDPERDIRKEVNIV